MRVLRIHREPELRQVGEFLCLRRRKRLRRLCDIVGKCAERALRRNRRVELADGTGGGVARICKQWFTGLRASGVEPLEPRAREVYLALGDEVNGAGQPHRHFANGADVMRDVLARDAIAACRRAYQFAFCIRQNDLETVDLQFEIVGRNYTAHLADPFVECAYLLF